ncbi:MAG: peptidyl-prolyl cis-trans isomerase [Phycisphaerae bacterium]|nr:peptidyl-prolyl cis-trans isomerase [Phycisphaerae bacterium]
MDGIRSTYKDAAQGSDRHPTSWRRIGAATCIALLANLLGCQTTGNTSARRVGEAWPTAAQAPRVAPSTVPPEPDPQASSTPQTTTLENSVIATVNGTPLYRGSLVHLLLAGHGPGMLEQMVVLEGARRLAADRGIAVTQTDIDREYDRSIRQLVGTATRSESDTFDQQAGQAILDGILARRNISEREYRLAVERNAYLRKIVTAELRITSDQVRREYDRVAADRLSIRHIELKDPAQVARVRRLLDAGVPFPDLARLYSANATTAQNGGALEPFAADDPDVPALLREVGFALQDGETSNAVRIDTTYHILRRERLLPGRTESFETLRPELEQRLRDRLTAPAMQVLYRELYDGADISIYDPVLRDAVEQRRGAGTSNPQSGGP